MSALDVATNAVAKQWNDYMDSSEARQVASAVLAELAAAGYHVVQAGTVPPWMEARSCPFNEGGSHQHYRLRPLTDEASA